MTQGTTTNPNDQERIMTEEKKKRSKPFELLRTLYSFVIIFGIPGALITSCVPSFTIELSRVNTERVNATVMKKHLVCLFQNTILAFRIKA